MNKFWITLAVTLTTFLIFTGNDACAGADKKGNNAQIYSISIKPDTVSPGTRPLIRVYVQNTSSINNGNEGKAVFDILTTVTAPDGSKKSAVWQGSKFLRNQKKYYTFEEAFDTIVLGTYKVTFSVYNSGRTFLYLSGSSSFKVAKVSESQPQKAPVPDIVKPAAKPPQRPTVQPGFSQQKQRERVYVGLGGFLDTLNTSGGGTVVFWPFQNIAVQGSFGKGLFTSLEARTFYRFPFDRIRPYLGAGFLQVERELVVIDVVTTVKESSFTVFGGLEVPLYKNLHGYLDVSLTPLTELKQDVTNGSRQATVTVEYSPVTINTGIILYLF